MKTITKQLLALPYETPYFFCDNKVAIENYKLLQELLPDFKLYYAMKANPEMRLIQALGHTGLKFEIASVTELKLLESNGISLSDVIYSNPVKSPASIRATFESGVRFFVFDSINELEKLAKYAPGSNVMLRFLTSDRGSVFPLSRKFGAEFQDIVPMMSFASSVGLIPYGLTFHVGSQAHDPQLWQQALKLTGNALNDLSQEGITLKAVDVGGGFPVQYTGDEPKIQTVARVIRDSVKKFLPYEVELIAEPGRFIAASSAVLISSVIGRTVHGGKNWLYLDAGALHGFMESIESDYTMRYPIETSIGHRNHKETLFTLTGPTCDSQDTFCYDVPLPGNLMVDDKLLFFNTGAYCSAYSTQFNGFPVPPNVFREDIDDSYFS